ncbi:MAG: type I-B CRISPR-associated protein Cas5b [Candidatus Zixiibacteriota bacterium]
MDKAVVFDISGKYGMFKKPYTPLSPVSYPVPPPTAIMGVIGAIIGLDKEVYLEELNRGEMKFGIKLLAPVKKYRAGLNMLLTKSSNYFRPKKKSPRTQVPAEFIKDAKFRIYFHHSDKELLSLIAEKLQKNQTTYTPVLGIAQCIAETEFIGIHEIQYVSKQGEFDLACCIPKERANVHFTPGNRIYEFRVPSRMLQDRTVTRYDDIYVDEMAGKIKVNAKKGYEIIDDEKILLF